ncbi:MAG: hypothetical protein MI923_25335 [Phycisphaerales bacterium]|nr:hypothetical protein [Phycisphaerales bacterium]
MLFARRLGSSWERTANNPPHYNLYRRSTAILIALFSKKVDASVHSNDFSGPYGMTQRLLLRGRFRTDGKRPRRMGRRAATMTANELLQRRTT